MDIILGKVNINVQNKQQTTDLINTPDHAACDKSCHQVRMKLDVSINSC